MQSLSVEAIRDFQVCELFYECRYDRELPEAINSRELFIERFDNTLKKVATFFFYKKQSGNVPSFNALLNRWEKLWFPADMTAYDMAVEQHEIAHGNYASFSNVATAALEKFHDTFCDDDSIPVLIDEDFIVPIGRKVKLNGNFDLILRKDNSYRVIKWWGRRTPPRNNHLLLDFAALRYAFEHRSDTPRSVEYCLYDMGSSKGGFMDIERPRIQDIDALHYWALEINGKENFVPRRGYTSYCKNCPFDATCRDWEDWPHVKNG